MVPKLRFKNFVLPWKTTTINGKVDIISGFPFEGKHITDNASGTRLMRGVNVSEGVVRHTKDIDRYYPLSAENHLRYMLKSGDIVIGMDGSKVGRNSARINHNDVGSLLVQRVARIRDIGMLNTSYLFQLLNSTYFYDYVDRVKTSSGIPHISLKQINEFQIGMPSIEEQTKIADFISSVDEKITLLSKQYNLLCQYKKGMMRKIFNQEVRFRDENGDIFPAWQENILSNLGNAYSGLTGKKAEDFGKGTFYITYKQIFDNRIIQPKDFGLVCISKNEKQNKVKYGDLFFTTSSETPDEVAFCSVFLETEMSDCYLNSFCFGYRLKNIDKNHPVFLSFLFRSEYFRSKVKTLAQGSTRYNISKAQFMMLSVNIPVTKEQTKIANFLSALDDKIAIKKVELDRLKTWKQGLLQQMFI